MKNFINSLPYMFSQYDRWFYLQTLIFLAVVIYLFVLVLCKKNINIIAFSLFLFVIFKYTFSVIPARARDRIQIVMFEKRDIIPVANHGYHLDLFASYPCFLQNTKILHHSILDNSIGLSEADMLYLGKYRGIKVVHTDEVQLKFYKKETI